MTNRIAALLALLLTLAACAGPVAPPDRFHRIEPAMPAAPLPRPALAGVLEAGRLAADGVVAERALAFSHAEGGPLAHYKYDFWSEPPALLLQDRLAHYLEGTGIAQRVVTPELRVLPDWVLHGKVRRFELIADGREAVVGMELAVVSARDGRLLLLKTYEVRAKADSERVEDGVRAMQGAVSGLFARFAADLGQAAQARP